MDALTLAALRGSIDKWRAIEERRGTNYASTNCPLCRMFMGTDLRYSSGDCAGCPVMLRTGVSGCRSTPYHHNDQVRVAQQPHTFTDEQVAAARAEREFLESLLPPEGDSVVHEPGPAS